MDAILSLYRMALAIKKKKKKSPCELSLVLSIAVKRLVMDVFVVLPDSLAHTCNVADSVTVSAAGTDTTTVEGGKRPYKTCMIMQLL